MSKLSSSRARAVADLTDGQVLATVEIAAPPERVFRALASAEIVEWWARPGVFDTREWEGEVRVGGRWRASGVARGLPYVLEGEFLEVDPPRKLVHTWHRVGTADPPTRVTYLLERLDGGTRITLRHEGFATAESGANAGAGWESSFERLAEMLATTPSPKPR
jgi:uncharacterized protein YndB with AHSA1/START domain